MVSDITSRDFQRISVPGPEKKSSNGAFESSKMLLICYCHIQSICSYCMFFLWYSYGIPMTFQGGLQLFLALRQSWAALRALQNLQPAAGDNAGTATRPWLHISKHCRITCVHCTYVHMYTCIYIYVSRYVHHVYAQFMIDLAKKAQTCVLLSLLHPLFFSMFFCPEKRRTTFGGSVMSGTTKWPAVSSIRNTSAVLTSLKGLPSTMAATNFRWSGAILDR